MTGSLQFSMLFRFAGDASLYCGLIDSIEPQPCKCSPNNYCPEGVSSQRISIKTRRKKERSNLVFYLNIFFSAKDRRFFSELSGMSYHLNQKFCIGNTVFQNGRRLMCSGLGVILFFILEYIVFKSGLTNIIQTQPEDQSNL